MIPNRIGDLIISGLGIENPKKQFNSGRSPESNPTPEVLLRRPRQIYVQRCSSVNNNNHRSPDPKFTHFAGLSKRFQKHKLYMLLK